MSENNTEYQGMVDSCETYCNLEQILNYVADCDDEYKKLFFMELVKDPLFRGLAKCDYIQEPIGVYRMEDGKAVKIGEEAESDLVFRSNRYKDHNAT